MPYNFIGNGVGNSAHTESFSSIVNGYKNNVASSKGFVGNGYKNVVSGSYSSIVGGRENALSGQDGFIGGGVSNTLSGNYGSIAGGIFNRATADRTFIGGGASNSATTVYSVVVGGSQNLASGNRSAILNGSGNTVSGAYSAAIGGQGINGSLASTVYIPNLHIQFEKKVYAQTGGTNPTFGTVSLSSGEATVVTSAITINSCVFITAQSSGNTGSHYISYRNPGTSFNISSTNGSDSSNVAWWIVEPA